jgi:hypothetical protein
MTPAEFTAAIARLGWSRQHVARQLQCDTNLPRYWSLGEQPVPLGIARWLWQLVQFHERNPPGEWRAR